MDYKEKIAEYYTSEHQKSQQKIKYGILCMIAIPLVFLILMFTMKSSKLVYLVLWIAALFIISAYLISVEYRDYTMQKQLKAFIGEEANQPLIEFPDIIDLTGLEDNKIQKKDKKILKKDEKIPQKDNAKLKQNNNIVEKKQEEMENYSVQKSPEIQKEYENISQEEYQNIYQKEYQSIGQKDRTADLEKEIQMLREIAQLRTQLGMGDYSSLYKEHAKSSAEMREK